MRRPVTLGSCGNRVSCSAANRPPPFRYTQIPASSAQSRSGSPSSSTSSHANFPSLVTRNPTASATSTKVPASDCRKSWLGKPPRPHTMKTSSLPSPSKSTHPTCRPGQPCLCGNTDSPMSLMWPADCLYRESHSGIGIALRDPDNAPRAMKTSSCESPSKSDHAIPCRSRMWIVKSRVTGEAAFEPRWMSRGSGPDSRRICIGTASWSGWKAKCPIGTAREVDCGSRGARRQFLGFERPPSTRLLPEA